MRTMPVIKDAAYYLNNWCSTVHNVTTDEPAELFDTHPLTEMILTSEAESSISDSLVIVENQWRPEWHKNGVQVPVNPTSSFHQPKVSKLVPSKTQMPNHYDMKTLMPLQEESKITKPATTTERFHRFPLYQLDDLDVAWLSIVNEERDCLGSSLITVEMFEKVMESLEHLSYVKMLEKLKALEAESLEFDENAKCDVCMSYEGEDDNELVFCDGCFLCVHQACYGIPKLPDGSWICRQCEAGVKSTTPCTLCPNTGGAMKTTEDGSRWCHISCALWVPEVSFGNVDLMEPVLGLDNIPQARRRLLCSICRSRYGAPIQCSHKKCKVAFHVTCGFQSNLIMRQELVDSGVRLLCFCPRHSRKDQKQHPKDSTDRKSERLDESNDPTRPSSSSQSKNPPSDRKQKLLEMENNFHTLINDKELELWLKTQVPNSILKKEKKSKIQAKNAKLPTLIPDDVRSAISVYWRLKRRSNFNQPLINPPPFHWRETASKAAETTKEALLQADRAAYDLHALEAFRRIRFGLDRSRLVVDMVLQRERRKFALFRRMWRIFELQARLLMRKKPLILSKEDQAFFSTAHLGNSIYDNWKRFEHSKPRNESEAASEKTKLKNTSPSKPAETALNPEPSAELTCPEPTDTILYSISYKQLLVSEDIRKRLRSALESVKDDPKHRMFFKDNLHKTAPSRSLTRERIFKRPSTALSLQNATGSATTTPTESVTPTENGYLPAKRLKRLSLKYADDSFCTHSIPILTKLSMDRLDKKAFENIPIN